MSCTQGYSLCLDQKYTYSLFCLIKLQRITLLNTNDPHFMYNNPALVIPNKNQVIPQPITHQSPSNIALVKYWGKYGRQYPRNASISFTLSKAITTTQLSYQWKQNQQDQNISLQFTFENKVNELFARKMINFLESITDIFPFLPQLDLQISSSNSFPHSSGIASSASSMSALALCLCALEQQLFGTLTDKQMFLQKASYIARLGSGSACRSVYAKAAVWGKTEAVTGSSNDYAVSFGDQLHPIFEGFGDAILIVSRAEKKVSSRAGHALMNTHPFAPIRYEQAQAHMKALAKVLQTGDLERFIEIVELEALTLHGLMMSSTPSYTLMEPNTLEVIKKIRAFREETKLPICFTLDAGPNVHVLYPQSIRQKAKAFIEVELVPLCQDNYWLDDGMNS